MCECIQLLSGFRQTPCGVWHLDTPQNICRRVYYQNTSQDHFYKRILLRNSHLILVPRIVLPVPRVNLMDVVGAGSDQASLPWLLRSLKCVLWPKVCQSWWCVCDSVLPNSHPLVFLM